MNSEMRDKTDLSWYAPSWHNIWLQCSIVMTEPVSLANRDSNKYIQCTVNHELTDAAA